MFPSFLPSYLLWHAPFLPSVLPSFLPSRYGVGYSVTIEKKGAEVDPAAIVAFVQTHVPAALLLTSVGMEVALQLPFAASSKFEALFADIDAQKESLGINSYGVSVTTLEEVFLKVARADQEEATANAVGQEPANDTTKAAPSTGTIDRKSLYMRHLYAMLHKRYIYFKRDYKAWVWQFALPMISITIGLCLVKFSLRAGETTNLNTMTHTVYNPDLVSDRLPIPISQVCYTDPLATDFQVQVCRGSGQGLQEEVGYCSDADFSQWDDISNSLERMNTDPYILGGDDMTPYDDAYALSSDLLESRGLHKASQYGAYMLLEASESLVSFILYKNYTAPTVVPVYVNLMHGALLKTYGDEDATLTTHFQRFPKTVAEQDTAQTIDALLTINFFMIAYGFIPPGFALFVVNEKQNKSKLAQRP